MSRTVTVAAVQTAAHDRTALAEAWPRIAGRIRDAARAGAQLIVVPEGTLPAYVLGYEALEEGEIAAAIAQTQAIAREHNAVIVIGAARKDGDRVFNSALAIDADGSMAGAADKHFLWHFDRQWFAAGERLQPIDTSLGKIGALVCADGRIPTIARTLVDRGAEILVMPTAWVTSGRDPANLENIQADLLARVRARENDVPFVAANKCGVELGCVAYCGKSQILRADGSVAALASQDGEETIVAQMEIRTPRPHRTDARADAEIDKGEAKAVPIRLAITPRPPREGDAARLKVLEADLLLSPQMWPPFGSHDLDNPFGFVEVSDDQLMDPGLLPKVRMGGFDFAIWRTSYDPEWQERFARARALELRMYVVVIDEARNRAYAVDPDGVIVCGTYDGYEIASFTYDPARTAQTLVAPGTDVRAGLERAALHATP
jgi:predicted amidohydrolase